MNRSRVLQVLVLLAVIVASSTLAGAQAPPKTAETSSLHQLDWITGGAWVAELKDERGEPLRIENRMRWSENGQLIKFITTFISHNKPEVHYEGVYAWNPSTKQISFWYTDREGNFTQGTAVMSGNTLTQDFEIFHNNGRGDKLRSLIVRDTPDSYNWNVSSVKDDKWNEIFHLRYTREK